eukprot:3941176-Rhodomonas_salina.1
MAVYPFLEDLKDAEYVDPDSGGHVPPVTSRLWRSRPTGHVWRSRPTGHVWRSRLLVMSGGHVPPVTSRCLPAPRA